MADRRLAEAVARHAAANGRRALPSVARLLAHPDAAPLAGRFSRAELTQALRLALAQARAGLQDAPPSPKPTDAALLARAAALLDQAARPGLRRVINATGIVLHTNLGRAPLAPEALAAVAQVAAGYSNLEFDLSAGARGSRMQSVEPLLREITGAEAAVAVNNNAAAVLLTLAALAPGGEVVVSRGELVEIGGGFRIPDVIRQGGARLVEVGTTNRTRLEDYRAAIGPHTRVLLKVHPSNYRMLGFTQAVGLPALAALARDAGLLLVEDLGSGALLAPGAPGRAKDATVADSLAAGVDVVAFSGDKLLGGPQAGLVVGRAAAIAPLRRHPLMRALRLDKMTLAALEATLRLYRDPARAAAAVPVLRMLSQHPAALRARAARLAARLAALLPGATVAASLGYAGGGSLPEEQLESAAVTLAAPSPDALAAALRRGEPAVVARIAQGLVWLDMLTVADDDLESLARAVAAALEAGQA